MLRNILIFVIGNLFGVLIFSSYNSLSKNNYNSKYIKLTEDFVLSNWGIIKKGTLLKIDQPMNEGFSRCILYINKKGDAYAEMVEYEKENFIKPYWIFKDSSIIK
jgi:hypothetical protein